MATAKDLRNLALALDGVEEQAHHRTADFRVHGKIFTGLSEDERVGYAKLSLELQGSLILSHPDDYYAASGVWGQKGWTHFVLRALRPTEVRVLLEEAHSLVSAGRHKATRARATSQRSTKKPAAKRR